MKDARHLTYVKADGTQLEVSDTIYLLDTGKHDTGTIGEIIEGDTDHVTLLWIDWDNGDASGYVSADDVDTRY